MYKPKTLPLEVADNNLENIAERVAYCIYEIPTIPAIRQDGLEGDT
jgi:hypothetical protein